MCEFCHVVGLVKFGGIDFVNGIGVDLLLGTIVTLHQYSSLGEVFYDPTADKGRGWIPKPDIALAGKVVLALHDST